MKKANVFTASWGQLEGRHSNIGDIVIFEAIIDMLKSFPSVNHVYCYSGDVQYTDRTYRVHSANPFTLSGLVKVVRNIAKSDLVLLGGGELVQTKSSFFYLVGNLAPGLLSLILGKKCLAIGVGIGNAREVSTAGKKLARFILNRIECVCVRDRASLQNALSIGIKKRKIYLTADLAFYFEAVDIAPEQPRWDTVLFCPRFTGARKGSVLPASITRRSNFQKHSKDFDHSADGFAKLLKALTREYDVIILPCYNGKNFSCRDVEFAKRIFRLAGSPKKAKIYDGPMSIHSVLNLLGNTFLTVGVPLHSLILTSIAKHSIIGVSYASKCFNFMKELGLEKFVVDISESFQNLDSDYILALIKECTVQRNDLVARIGERVHELREQNSVHFYLLTILLNRN